MNPNKDAHANGQSDTNSVELYQPTDTQVSRVVVDENFSAPDELLQAQSLANTLDTAVRLPFIGLRVGLDFLIGLIPGIGDSIMLLASMRIVYLGHKLKVPKAIKLRMLRNALFDYALGFIPIVGDIIDLFFKANQRNVRLIEQWWVSEHKEQIDALAQLQLEQWQKAQDEQAQNDNSNMRGDG